MFVGLVQTKQPNISNQSVERKDCHRTLFNLQLVTVNVTSVLTAVQDLYKTPTGYHGK